MLDAFFACQVKHEYIPSGELKAGLDIKCWSTVGSSVNITLLFSLPTLTTPNSTDITDNSDTTYVTCLQPYNASSGFTGPGVTVFLREQLPDLSTVWVIREVDYEGLEEGVPCNGSVLVPKPVAVEIEDTNNGSRIADNKNNIEDIFKDNASYFLIGLALLIVLIMIIFGTIVITRCYKKSQTPSDPPSYGPPPVPSEIYDVPTLPHRGVHIHSYTMLTGEGDTINMMDLKARNSNIPSKFNNYAYEASSGYGSSIYQSVHHSNRDSINTVSTSCYGYHGNTIGAIGSHGNTLPLRHGNNSMHGNTIGHHGNNTTCNHGNTVSECSHNQQRTSASETSEHYKTTLDVNFRDSTYATLNRDRHACTDVDTLLD